MSQNLLGNTVYLTNDEYATLIANGSVTLASGTSVTYSENDTYIVPEVIDTSVTSGSTNPVTSNAVYQALKGKQGTGNYFTYISYSASVAKETKTVYKMTESPVYIGNLIVGGEASNPGLLTQGICGVSAPTASGSCQKTHLYLNYDSNNTYNYKVILGATRTGDHIYGNVYKYTAVRGDQMEAYVNSIVPDGAIFTDTTYTLTQDSTDKHKLIFASSSGAATTITIPDNNTWRGIQDNLISTSKTESLSAYQGKVLSEAKVNRQDILADGIDLNTVTTSGFYRLQSTVTNGPSAGISHGQLLVVHGGGDTISQFAMPYSSSVVYMRNGNAVNNASGTWKSWVTLANTATTLAGYGIKDANINNGVITLGPATIAPLMYVSTTWGQLGLWKAGSVLKKGTIYRITDYKCTTTQADTQSAGHQFDILVVADDVNKLNENAHAIIHSGDTYFANSKLEAWEIKYCLNNDTSRFAWADSTNGKGVIYYMKDEFNNECPYDFKNIQFKRYAIQADHPLLSSLDGQYLGYKVNDSMYGVSIPDSDDYAYFYTFSLISGSSILDFSIQPDKLINGYQYKNKCEHNIIKPFSTNQSIDEGALVTKFSLNNIVFMDDSSAKVSYYSQSHNTIESRCFNMSFMNGCTGNYIFADNRDFICGTNFQNNIIHSGCGSMSFNDGCNFNTIGNNCVKNVFNCYSSSFGNRCAYNSFSCSSSSFGNNCADNAISGYGNSFGNNCSYNTINNGDKNSFGNSCSNNILNGNCDCNTFGNGCSYNTIDSYAQYNIFDNNVRYVKLTSNTLGTQTSYLQYIHIHGGIKGTSSSTLTINAIRNLSYSTDYFANNSKSIILN